MAENRCEVCRRYELTTKQDPIDQKVRCTECNAFVEDLSPSDRQFLRSHRIAF